MKLKPWGYRLSIGLTLMSSSACLQNTDFAVQETACVEASDDIIGFDELKHLYGGETIKIGEDLKLDAYIASSDHKGNFFGVLYLQSEETEETSGLRLEIDLRDSHLFYPPGNRVRIHLKGLYLGKQNDLYELGGAFPAFGNLSVGRLPVNKVTEHLKSYCDPALGTAPKIRSIAELNDSFLGTRIALEGVEFTTSELGATFAKPEEETTRTLIDCLGNSIGLLNSGFSDFRDQILPEGNGLVKGVLVKKNGAYQMIINDPGDLIFPEDRCFENSDNSKLKSVFISELADPENNSEARFIELYNASQDRVTLNGWKLLRYTNDNLFPGGEIDLSRAVLAAKSTLTISSNALEFEKVYGFPPDLEVSANGPADSNGDDNIVLLNPLEEIVDVFGVIGEDGSGTDHEFEDGGAFRKPNIVEARPVFAPEEWTINNDTGAFGTIKLPLKAPEDFSPGKR